MILHTQHGVAKVCFERAFIGEEEFSILRQLNDSVFCELSKEFCCGKLFASFIDIIGLNTPKKDPNSVFSLNFVP